MSDIDRAIDSLNRLSLLAQLLDMVRMAEKASRPVCGSCFFWMKSSLCPRERNVNGMSRGPSCEDAICGKFKITNDAINNIDERFRQAVDFATQHGLPMPTRAYRQQVLAETQNAAPG